MEILCMVIHANYDENIDHSPQLRHFNYHQYDVY